MTQRGNFNRFRSPDSTRTPDMWKLKKFGETQTQETLLIPYMRRKWGVAILIASADNFELLKEIQDKEGRTDENVLKP